MGKIKFSKRVSASELEPNAFSDLNPSNYNFVRGNSSDNTNSSANSLDIADSLSVASYNSKAIGQVSKTVKTIASHDVSKKKINFMKRSKSEDDKAKDSSKEKSFTGKNLHILEEVCI
ncbi:hypothetical protein ACHAXS_000514 [Conticribra weissflogii]